MTEPIWLGDIAITVIRKLSFHPFIQKDGI